MSFNINSRKGWFRLWVLASLIYLFGLFVYIENVMWGGGKDDAFILWGIIGVAGMQVVGWLVVWVIRGFRQPVKQ
ncbi:hypothetical protein [Metapseudomonas resinovorans]|uniref:Uncharacterized protein n=1 Tax=Metapseudomonas resinovorans NBRC 106553 TaxID=1245471 RepID=S6AHE8_METRE|nr:hypothetical protein [Pseudomonas resinovorans]BAN47680.1 hypothetical protein PCA10_19480 [Pseudomonas resinovorans NBRC 106553]